MGPVNCEHGISLREGCEVRDIYVLSSNQGCYSRKNMQFVCTEVQGYLPIVVREFYINMKENQRAETLLETTVMGKHIRITPDPIAHSLQYVRPAASDRPYPLRAISDFDAQLFAEAMCTRPVTMSGFVRKEFVPWKLKPKYALMNKIIHDRIGPKGNEKSHSKEQIQFLYEVMTGKLINYALVIWCVMRDFLQFSHESKHIPFPYLVTSLVEAAGIRGVAKEKRVLPRLGPITNKTEAKSRAASMRPQPSQPPVAIPGVPSSTAPAPMSTSPLKRMERRIKRWFKCILASRVIFSEENLSWQMPLLSTWREIRRSWMTASMRMHFLLPMMRRTLCSSLLG